MSAIDFHIKILKNYSIAYYNVINKEYVFIDKKNIEDYKYVKYKYILKSKNILYDGSRISLYDLLFLEYDFEKINVLSKSDISLFDGDSFIYNKDYLKSINDKDYPNLLCLKKMFSINDWNNPSLFSNSNWVVNLDNKIVVPFLFYKKEDFKIFKSLDEDIINFILNNNKYFLYDDRKINDMRIFNSLSLFISILSFNKNIVFLFPASSLIIVLKLLFIVLNNLIVQNISLEDFIHDKNLKHLFRLFLINLKESFDNMIDLNNSEFIQSKINIYSDILRSYVTINYNLSEKEYNNSELYSIVKYFENIKNVSSLIKVLDKIHDFKILENKFNFLHQEDYLKQYLNKSYFSLFEDNNPILIGEYTFYPLVGRFALEKEGIFMNNCVGSQFHYSSFGNFSSGNNFCLFFHVVDGSEFLINKKLKSTHDNIESIYKNNEINANMTLKLFFEFKNSNTNDAQFENNEIKEVFSSKKFRWEDINISVSEIKKRFNKRVPLDKEKKILYMFKKHLEDNIVQDGFISFKIKQVF